MKLLKQGHFFLGHRIGSKYKWFETGINKTVVFLQEYYKKRQQID